MNRRVLLSDIGPLICWRRYSTDVLTEKFKVWNCDAQVSFKKHFRDYCHESQLNVYLDISLDASHCSSRPQGCAGDDIIDMYF